MTPILADMMRPISNHDGGDFLYIGAVDLVPEFKDRCGRKPNIALLGFWTLGIALLLLARLQPTGTR